MNETFCSSSTILMNLILMCIMWTASSCNFYLMTFFLKYIPGNIYINTSLSNLSQATAYAVAGFFMNSIGIRASYFTGFMIGAGGGLFMMLYVESTAIMPILVLLAQFGVALSFNICYLGMSQLFPVTLTGVAFGICNLFARFSTVMSAPVAELSYPIPMIIFTILCIVPGLLSLLLNTKTQGNNDME